MTSNQDNSGFKNHPLRREQLDFEHWFQTPLGRQLLAAERSVVERYCEHGFGAHQLELAVSHRLPVGGLGNCAHRIIATRRWSQDMPSGVVVCDPEELPFASGTIDLVVMHHVLDFSPSPHQALRECHRVLKGSGHLIIVGFNPLSLWGVGKLLVRGRRAPWSGRFIRRSRLEDWLELLDLSVQMKAFQFFRPPVQSAPLLDRLRFLERWFSVGSGLPGGAFYILMAEKRVGARIRLAQQWRRKNVVGLPIANRSGLMGPPSSHRRVP